MGGAGKADGGGEGSKGELHFLGSDDDDLIVEETNCQLNRNNYDCVQLSSESIGRQEHRSGRKQSLIVLAIGRAFGFLVIARFGDF